jgi:hypothetical protein
MMFFVRRLCFFILLSAFLFPEISHSQTLPEKGVGASSPAAVMDAPLVRTRDVVRVLSSYFPEVYGNITSVDGTTVSINKGSAAGITEGMVLSVVRKGTPFRDPYTDEVIGYREEKLGRLSVESVSEQSSTGFFAREPSRDAPVVGDRVRLSGAPIPLAVIPQSNYADIRVMAHLEERLDHSERFSVIDPFKVEATLGSLGRVSREDPLVLKRLSVILGVDYLFLVDTTIVGQRALMTISVVSGATGKPIAHISAMMKGISPLMAEVGKGEHRAGGFITTSLPPLSKPSSVLSVSFIPKFIVPIGKSVSGRPLFAFSDGKKVLLGEFSPDGFRVRYSEGNPGVIRNLHIFLSAGHLMDDHPASDKDPSGWKSHYQIVVSSIVEGTPDSYVLDVSGGRLRRIWKHVRLYLRVVHLPDGHDHLLAQKMGVNRPFLGKIFEMDWVRDHFEKGKALDWPPRVRLFGSLPVTISGKTRFLQLSKDNHLTYLGANGDLRFKSPFFLGGYDDHYVFGRPHALLPVRTRMVHLKGRILTIASSKGGSRPIVIVYKNVPVSSPVAKFQGYQYGQVYFYRWTGVSWMLLGRLTRVRDFITDIAIGTDPSTLKPRLLVATEPVFNFMNIQNLYENEGKIEIYPLPGKVLKALGQGGVPPSLMNRPASGSRP